MTARSKLVEYKFRRNPDGKRTAQGDYVYASFILQQRQGAHYLESDGRCAMCDGEDSAADRGLL